MDENQGRPIGIAETSPLDVNGIQVVEGSMEVDFHLEMEAEVRISNYVIGYFTHDIWEP